LGRLHGWVLRVYEQMWQRARQFWTDPMWIRVTDEMKAASFLQINEPVMGEVMAPAVDPQTGEPVVDSMTGQPMMMPAMEVVDQKNRIAELDMDIILDQDDDSASLAQEVWGELVQLVSSSGGLQVVFEPAFELMIEASPIADKTRIIELLKGKREEMQGNQMQQLQQQVQQLTEQLQAKQQTDAAVTAAEVEDKQAATLQKVASAHKTAAEADTVQAQLFGGLGLDPMLALQD